MKATILLASVAALTATAATAEPRTRTKTFDGPNYDASRTVVRDREAGTLSRDTSVTRASDGAVATREFDRVRTGSGVTASGSATGFRGNTRSFERHRPHIGARRRGN